MKNLITSVLLMLAVAGCDNDKNTNQNKSGNAELSQAQPEISRQLNSESIGNGNEHSLAYQASAANTHYKQSQATALTHKKDYPNYGPNQQQLKKWAKEYDKTPFKVLSVTEQQWDDAPAINISFSVPLAPGTTVSQYITVTDEKNTQLNAQWIVNANGTQAIWPWVSPQARFHIEISNQIQSFNGRMLSQTTKKTINTRRLDAKVNFSGNGSQISPQLSDGLMIESVNIEAVDIDFWKIKPANLSQFLQYRIDGYIYGLERIRQQADLVYSGRYDLAVLPNQRKKSVVPIDKSLQAPGLYFAVMKGAGDYPYDYEVMWFTVSSVAVHHRQYLNQSYLFVSDVVTGLPVNNANVELLDNKSKVILAGTTDDKGMFQISLNNKKPVLAAVGYKDNFSILKLSQPALDLTEFNIPERKQLPIEMFLYGPRNLYRPGEKVVVNGLLRDNDGIEISIPQVNAKFIQPDRKVYKSFNWQVTQAGFFTTDLKLDGDAQRGTWKLEVTANQKDKTVYEFQVEDFLPERMTLELSSASKIHIDNSTSKNIKVQGDYLYGAPASNNRVKSDLKLRQARTLSEKYNDFLFGLEQNKNYDRFIQLEDQETDETGSAVVQIDKYLEQQPFPIAVNATVNLLESGGRPVTRTFQQTIWPRPTMIGLRGLWDGDIAYPNSNLDFELIHIDAKENLQAAQDVLVEVIKVNSHYYWQWNSDWSRQQTNKEMPVYNRVMDWKAGEKARISVPVEYGNYRIQIKDKNNLILNSYSFFAGWRWHAARQGSGERPDQVGLSWDKGAYRAGDSAILTLQAAEEGEAIITIESNQLLWAEQVSLSAGSNQIEIPIHTSWNRHDIYASAMMIRKGAEDEKQLPKRSLGLIHLPLERSHRQLEVSILTENRVAPESQLQVEIRVNRPKNSETKGDSDNLNQKEDGYKTEKTYVTLAAVDTGILNISNYKTPKPWEYFYGARQYQTSMRDNFGKLVEQTTDRRAIQRYGGDAKLERGGEQMQSEVQIVSLFSGLVEVAQDGTAKIDLDLPYFNGELRLMALAFSGNQFGHQDKSIKVSAPIVAEINMPKYLARGDRSVAVMDIRNMTELPASIDVAILANAALNAQSIEKTMLLQPKERQTLTLPIEAMRHQGRGTVTMALKQAKAGQINPEVTSLTRTWGLPIRPLYPPRWNQVRLALSGSEEQNIDNNIFENLVMSETVARLTVSTTPPFESQQHLRSLFQYPYGCLEQTTSRLWPLLLAERAEFKDFLKTHPNNRIKNQNDAIQSGIGRISGMQRSNGSFGLWSKNSPEHHWLTAFATDALLEANKLGYAVDDKVLKNAVKRLQAYLSKRGNMYSENRIYSNNRAHYNFAYKAYAGYVLAKYNQAKIADLRWLLDNKASASKNKVALAHLAFALEMAGDPNKAKQAWNKALLLDSEQRFYGGDYTSEVRDLSWTSELAMRSKIAQGGENLLAKLSDIIISRTWLSTQERFALYRLAKYLEVTPGSGVDFNISSTNRETGVRQNNRLVQDGDFVQTYAGNDIPESIAMSNSDDQPTQFVKFEVQGYEKTMPEPSQDGLTVTRQFFELNGRPKKVDTMKTGDWMLVQITVDSIDRQRVPDALIVDYLPAGLELENQNLENSRKISLIKIDGKTINQWQKETKIVHEAFQDDRYVAAVELDGYRPAHVFYLVKAVTPGLYNVSPVQVEDMVRPELRAVSDTPGAVTIKAQ